MKCVCKHGKKRHDACGWLRCRACGCGRFIEKKLRGVAGELWWELHTYREEAQRLRKDSSALYGLEKEGQRLSHDLEVARRERAQWEAVGRASVALILSYMKQCGHTVGNSCNLCETAIQTLTTLGFQVELNKSPIYDKRIYDI